MQNAILKEKNIRRLKLVTKLSENSDSVKIGTKASPCWEIEVCMIYMDLCKSTVHYYFQLPIKVQKIKICYWREKGSFNGHFPCMIPSSAWSLIITFS